MREVIVVYGVSVGPGWAAVLDWLEGELVSGRDEEVTEAPLEEGNALDVGTVPELVSDCEEQGTELEEPPGLETGVCVPVAVAMMEDWLETEAALLGTPEEEVIVTIVEVVVELPVPGEITGGEKEGLTVLDGVRLGSETGNEVL